MSLLPMPPGTEPREARPQWRENQHDQPTTFCFSSISVLVLESCMYMPCSLRIAATFRRASSRSSVEKFGGAYT